MYAVGGSGDMDDGNGTGSANAQLHAVSCTALEESDAIHTSPATDVCVHAESNQVLSTGEDGYIRGVHLLDGGRVLGTGCVGVGRNKHARARERDQWH